MKFEYTDNQKQSLYELGVSFNERSKCFDDIDTCNREYTALVKKAEMANRQKQKQLLKMNHKVFLCDLQDKISEALCADEFTQITTPTLVSRESFAQVKAMSQDSVPGDAVWLSEDTAMRSSLAPGMYEVSAKLLVNHRLPLEIFEIGSCFRPNADSDCEPEEFTMLNVMVWHKNSFVRTFLIKKAVEKVMKAAGISDYEFVRDDSVSGKMVLRAVTVNGIDIASISEIRTSDHVDHGTCTSLTLVLENLIMNKVHSDNIFRYSKSTTYLDGARL